MSLLRPETVPENVLPRFGIASDYAGVPEDYEVRKQAQIQARDKIYDAAWFLVNTVEPSRELSLALTHLEEALMWAGKAIYR